MSLVIRSTSTLIEPGNLKLRILIYSLPGCGKTTWAATAPNPGFIACETGHGQGLLSIADKGDIDYVVPANGAELDQICSGMVFKEKDTLVLDSLSEMVKSLIKDEALAIPRARGESDKRRRGIPELDDYGTMGELTRRRVKRLLDIPKHIIVTATERYDKPDPENGQAELLIGPDLPGQMFLGSTAMFDMVLRLRSRQVLRDKNDAKSRVIERYLLTQPDGLGTIAKSRLNVNGAPLLPKEVIVNLVTGDGTFPDILRRVQEAYEKAGLIGKPTATSDVRAASTV